LQIVPPCHKIWIIKEKAMPMTREKKRRLEAIGDLIAEQPIGSQADLVDQLRRLGIRTTQSSISRDLQELGIRRVNGRYVLKPWREVGAGDFEGVLGLIQGVSSAGPYMTIVNTSPNAGKMVAEAIDNEGWPEVAGTLPGDSRIFVASRTPEDQSALFDRFRIYLKRSGPPGVDHAEELEAERGGEEEAEDDDPKG
jgi:transcriptional regulator of arginine metabolism